VRDERGGDGQRDPGDIAQFAGEGLQQHETDEAQPDAVGDVVGQRDAHQGQERRDRLGGVVPRNLQRVDVRVPVDEFAEGLTKRQPS